MKRISLLIGVGLLVSVACPLVRDVRKDCQQLVTPALQTKVADALDLETYEAELLGLLPGATLCAVNVVVHDLVSEARGGGVALAKAALSPAEELRGRRGQAWLAAHPTPY